MRCAGMAHVGAYHEIGATFDKVAEWARGKGILDRPFVGVYYDNPETTPVEQLRSHAAVVLNEGESVEGSGLEEFEIPAGDYFVGVHMGPYDGMYRSWQEFMAAVAESGEKVDYDWTFEVYVNDCDQVAPEEIRTDLYVGRVVE